jgi:hypothetical protein
MLLEAVMKVVVTCAVTVVVSLLATMTNLSSQGPPQVERGQQVRVYVPTIQSRWVIGTYKSLSKDTLALKKRQFPLDAVQRLQVYRKVSRGSQAGKGALIGGTTLGLIGLMVGLAALSECQGWLDLSPCGGDFGDAMLVTAAAAGVGGAIGALVGLVVPRGHRWHEVSLHQRGVITPIIARGRIGFVASVRF